MKKRSEKEIKAKLKELWLVADGGGRDNDADPFVVTIGDGFVSMEVSQMYDAPPGLTYQQMDDLVKWFDVYTIHTGNDINEDGCETCDYGSRRGFTLTVYAKEPKR